MRAIPLALGKGNPKSCRVAEPLQECRCQAFDPKAEAIDARLTQLFQLRGRRMRWIDFHREFRIWSQDTVKALAAAPIVLEVDLGVPPPK